MLFLKFVAHFWRGSTNTCSWIPRKKNRVAHVAAPIGVAAAPIGVGTVYRGTWAAQPPPSLVCVLVSDGLPSPPNL